MSITKEFDELSFQLGDLTLAAIACGNESHQPVLCLHGYLDNAASFIPFMQHITKHKTKHKIQHKAQRTSQHVPPRE